MSGNNLLKQDTSCLHSVSLSAWPCSFPVVGHFKLLHIYGVFSYAVFLGIELLGQRVVLECHALDKNFIFRLFGVKMVVAVFYL